MIWGLALSGGGIYGAAHLGALAELEAMGLRADVLAGTSAGGIVALECAAGVAVDALTAFGSRVSRHPLDYFRPQVVRLALEALPFDPRPPATGLIDPTRFIAGLAELAGVGSLGEVKRPCAVTSVDLRALEAVAFVGGTGANAPGGADNWVVLTDSALGTALWATMAEPALFTPLSRPPRLFVDGGVADTLPVDWALRLGAERVLAVDVAVPGAAPRRFDICGVVRRSEQFGTRALSRVRVPPDAPVLTLAPQTGDVGFPGLRHYAQLVESGRQVVRAHADAVRRFLGA